MHATIFDCDGTLVDSERIGNEVLVEVAARYGPAPSAEEALTEFRGRKMADCVAQLEAQLGRGLPDDFVPQVRARMAEVFRERLRPIEGALDLVRSMRGPIAVASSAPREKIELTLALTGLLPWFEGRIFSSYEVDSWKPEPDLFLHAARALGVEAHACRVVEDSLPGIRAGVAAGMQVFAYLPHGIPSEIPREVTVVERLVDLRAPLGAGTAGIDSSGDTTA